METVMEPWKLNSTRKVRRDADGNVIKVWTRRNADEEWEDITAEELPRLAVEKKKSKRKYNWLFEPPTPEPSSVYAADSTPEGVWFHRKQTKLGKPRRLDFSE